MYGTLSRARVPAVVHFREDASEYCGSPFLPLWHGYPGEPLEFLVWFYFLVWHNLGNALVSAALSVSLLSKNLMASSLGNGSECSLNPIPGGGH